MDNPSLNSKPHPQTSPCNVSLKIRRAIGLSQGLTARHKYGAHERGGFLFQCPDPGYVDLGCLDGNCRQPTSVAGSGILDTAVGGTQTEFSYPMSPRQLWSLNPTLTRTIHREDEVPPIRCSLGLSSQGDEVRTSPKIQWVQLEQ